MDPFEELTNRVRDLTGLDARKAADVAADLYDGNEDGIFSASDIVRSAEKLGFEFEKRAPERPATATSDEPQIGANISMDPARVLSEVYEVCPRVLNANMPTLGRAPNELLAHAEFAEELEQLPEEIRALLVKIDLFEGKATFWLRDEANEIDRPIGPIDLTPYEDEHAMRDAFMTLLKRLSRVLAADFN
jgi:hypothetical protein